MNANPTGFQSELRISPTWLTVVLMGLGLALFFVSELPPDLYRRERMQDLALLILLVGATTWLLERWRPGVGRWFGLVGLVAAICLADRWLAVPGLLVLLVLPPALAAGLSGLLAGTAVAMGETSLLLLLDPGGAAAGSTAVAILALWSTFGVLAAILYSVRQVARWAWTYYRQASRLLEEARDRKVELEKALEDLAHSHVQLNRLNLLAQGLRRAAEDARTAKEEFVANVSHELRTPLNMITGFSETILQSPETYGEYIPPKLLSDLAVIHRNAEHLSALIDDVLDLGQIDADQMALTKDHVQFQAVAAEAVALVRPLFEAKGLYLEQDVPADLPPVFCDRTRIREVLLNLLSNAGRFTDEGGVHLRVRHDDNTLTASIADSGTGIASVDLPKLFQPFQQLDSSLQRRHGGTGLGLSISKRFIELHGGKIWVESQEGVGTTFFFRLPVVPPPPLGDGFMRGITPDWEFVQRIPSPARPVLPVTPRYVVMEQGHALRRLLTRYWHDAEVVPVTGLAQALEELERVPAQALLVNAVPASQAMVGLSTIQRLPNGTPAIFCSIPDVADASPDLGAAQRLVKPISQQDLLAALDRLGVAAGTILIVDDEPDALQLYGRMLKSAGRPYGVLQARDGQEALHILAEQAADAILLDLVMPRLDGFQFLELRSRDASLGKIPVVLVSARDRAGHPIVSSMLAVTQAEGISVQRLLAGIAALSRILSPAGPVGDPARPERLPD